jgi:hypothetical protein
VIDAYEFGRDALRILERARAVRSALAAERREMILQLAQLELAASRPRRGLAKRIAPQVGLSEPHVRRILSCALSDCAIESGVLSRHVQR